MTVPHGQASASPIMPQSETPSDMSNPYSASTRRPKIRNLNYIYEKDEVDINVDLNSLLGLFYHVDDPI